MAGRIVVGVDESVGARSALSWAAEECQLRDDTLLLVHVSRPDRWLNRYGDAGARAGDTLGSMLLDELAFGVRLRFPDLPLDLLLGHGDPADTLLDLSAMADLLVVGTTGSGSNLLSLIGSVSSRVAAQAHCPVVVVPERRVLTAVPRDPATVVVGVSDTAAGAAALRFAFAEAHRRGLGVTAVRGSAGGSADELPRLDLADYTSQFPDVPVTPLALRVEPAEAVLQAARNAELVVVGAHHSDNRWSSRLGPVPQTVLHNTNCPVVVIGTPRRHPAPPGETLRPPAESAPSG